MKRILRAAIGILLIAAMVAAPARAQRFLSSAWTDASFTATNTASVPAALAATATRFGLHIWNVGSASTVCINYTSTAVASGTGCASGSFPIAPGGAYLEDEDGNVTPEAVSIVCAGISCPLTIKVH